MGGGFTSVNPRDITNSGNASDLLNVRIEDKSVRTRYGFRQVIAAQANFATAFGAEYLAGYTSGLSAVEELITFERKSTDTSAKCRPYSHSINTSTGAVGAKTAITVSGVGTDLDAASGASWTGKAFGSSAYFVNPNETKSVKKYTLGTVTSWQDVGIPTAPSAPLTYSVLYGGSAGYTSLNWYNGGGGGTLTTGDVTYTGIAQNNQFAVSTGGFVTIDHASGSASGPASFIIDLNSHITNKDWTNNDIFYFTLQGGHAGWALDPSSVGVTFTNNDGSPLTFTADRVTCKPLSTQIVGQGTTWGVRVEFRKSANALSGYDKAGWDNIRKMTVSYTVLSNTLRTLIFSPVTVGATWIPQSRNPIVPTDAIFNYSYYFSTNAYESGLCSTSLTIPYSVLDGGGISDAAFPNGLGVHLRLTDTTSGDANVDQNKFYMYDTAAPQKWRLLTTQADSGTTFDYKVNYDEFHGFTAYTSIVPFKSDKCVNLCPFKGWMVWFYQGGTSSVRHSQVGNAEKQASDLDDPLTDFDPPVRGATFSMPGQQDEPLGGIEAGDALIVPGSLGVYAQVGTAPAYMTPLKRVAGSFGCANKYAFCRWKDDSGNPGMAYVSRSGQIYFVTVSPQFTGDVGAFVSCLSTPIYTGGLSVNTFLRDGQSLSDLSTVRVAVDEETDSLWIMCGKRALVLRRPHPELGEVRQWEAYEYNVATTFPYLAFSTKRWLKAIVSDGQIVEFERNSSTGANITGTLRDAGSAVLTPYWQSGTFVTPNCRIAHVLVERDTLTDTPALQVASTRQTSSVTCTSGKQFIRFGALQQGRNHVFKLTLAENSDPVRRLEVHLFAAGSRLTA